MRGRLARPICTWPKCAYYADHETMPSIHKTIAWLRSRKATGDVVFVQTLGIVFSLLKRLEEREQRIIRFINAGMPFMRRSLGEYFLFHR